MTKTAVLSDIHGNSYALRAVLADAARRGVSFFANLGDIFYGPLDPAGTWDILSAMDMPTIRGNQDRLILDEGEDSPTMRFVREQLSPEARDWVYYLPAMLQVRGLFMLHGAPGDDAACLMEDVSSGAPEMKSCADMLRGLPIPPPPMVLCGHSHIPRVTHCEGAVLVNPGSVGLQAYREEIPSHAVQTGDPRARYAVIEDGPNGWEAEIVCVEYDHDAAASLARRNGREDWALWLETGRA